MNLNEYCAMDATALAELVRQKEVKPAELTALAQTALKSVNKDLNCVAQEFSPIYGDENAPFSGVPTVAKDLVMEINGVPMTGGCRMLKNAGFVPDKNSEMFNRLLKTGLTTIATTTAPELGFNATTEALAYGGPTLNPWDVSRSPGGSSGGSAAAVAAGAVPVAHANDGGGSIRIPAAACGLLGLRPTRGRTPTGPDYLLPLMGFGIEFMLTRTVRDAAALLDIFEGPEPGAFFDIPRPELSYAQLIDRCVPRKRIAVMTHLKGTSEPDPEIRDGVLRTAEKLQELGHIVVEASPDYDYNVWRRANFVAWTSFLASVVKGLSDALDKQPTSDDLEAATLACAQAGADLSALDMHEALSMMNSVCRSIGHFMQDYDVMLLPTTRTQALSLGTLNQNDESLSAEGWCDRIFEFVPYTALFNMTGQPAISVPAGIKNGLPVGVQLVGRNNDDGSLLQLARQLEEIAPWDTKRPKIHATVM